MPAALKKDPTLPPLAGEALSQVETDAPVDARQGEGGRPQSFIDRGMAAIAQVREQGGGVPAAVVIARLETKLQQACLLKR